MFLHADSKDWSNWAESALGVQVILLVLSRGGSYVMCFTYFAEAVLSSACLQSGPDIIVLRFSFSFDKLYNFNHCENKTKDE